MNVIKKMMFTIFLLMMPIFVNANQIFLSCPTEIKKDAEFTCTVTGKSESVITSLSAGIKLGEKLKFVSFKADSIWQGNASNGVIDVYTSEMVTGSFKIGTLKLKSLGEGNNSVTLETVVFHDDNYDKIAVSSVRKDISLKKETIVKDEENSDTGNVTNQGSTGNGSGISESGNVGTTTDKDNNKDETNNQEDENNKISDSYLTNILIEGYNINFNKDVYEYTLNIEDESSLTIDTSVSDENVMVTINGNKNLINGSVIEINVKTVDDDLGVYKINIVKSVNDLIVDNKQEEKENDYMMIFIIIIAILVLINIVRILLNRRRRNDET